MKRTIRLATLAVLALAVAACSSGPQVPMQEFEKFVKQRLDGGGSVYVPSGYVANVSSLGRLVKSESDLPAVHKALAGNDERILFDEMERSGVRLLLLPEELPPGTDMDCLHARIVNEGAFDLLQTVYADGMVVIAGPLPVWARPDAAGRQAILAHARAGLAGTQPVAPDGGWFSQPVAGGVKVIVNISGPFKRVKALHLVNGSGPSVQAAIDAAVGRMKQGHPAVTELLPQARIDIGIVRPYAWIARRGKAVVSKHIQAGLDGIRLTGDGADLFSPPQAAVLNGLESAERLLEHACRSGGLDKDAWKQETKKIETFRLTHFREAAPGEGAVALFRLRPLVRAADVSRTMASDGLRDGADFLLRNLKADGMFNYIYNIDTNQAFTREYNLIRHNLATLTLIQAYELFRDRRYLDGARRAIEWNLALVKWDGNLAYFNHPQYDRHIKLGGIGCLLQVMTEYNRFERMPAWDRTIEGMADLGIKMQKENGHYDSFYILPGQTAPKEREVTIYPGEMNLGLVRASRLLKKDRFLKAAAKSIEYYRPWFNNGKDGRGALGLLGPYVPWEMAAMLELYEDTGDRQFAEYAFEMADWVIDRYQLNRRAESAFPDFLGGVVSSRDAYFSMPPWTSGVYGEGLVSVFVISLKYGDQARIEKYRRSAGLVQRFIRQMQWKEADTYLFSSPTDAIGAISPSLIGGTVRPDYVYHCLTVNYRVARFFRDEDFDALKNLPDVF